MAAEQARQLFDFLADANEIRTRPARTLDDARRVLWFDELPDTPGLLRTFLAPEAASPGEWMSIDRVDPVDPPQLPKILVPWVAEREVREFQAEQPPALAEAIPVELADIDPETGERVTVIGDRSLEESPDRADVLHAYDDWARRWSGWAAERRRLAPAVHVYTVLYDMAQGATEDAEQYELVLGLGYLTQESGGAEVRRHIIAAGAVARYDTSTGAIAVGPDPDSGGPLLEEDMLDVGDRASRGIADKVGERLEEAGAVEPESTGLLHEALRIWAQGVSADGRYRPTVERHRPEYGSGPIVSFAPALILRRRGSRSLVKALREISTLIERTGSPSGLVSFLLDPGSETVSFDTSAGADEPEQSEHSEHVEPDEVYFALPANAEQRTIADRLRTERLVVVQGPPGTGKTHTIANLVTDLLAHGKRVLITSHTARALKVLRDKLPEELQHLCVSRTDDGVQGQQELESSVKGILSAYGSYDAGRSHDEIRRLTGRLREARATQSEALLELRAIREMETYVYSADIGDYTGTPLQIAGRLRSEAPLYEWIGAVPESADPTVPVTPVTAAEGLALLHAVRAFTPEVAAQCADLPDPDAFPAANVFATEAEKIRQADLRVAAVREHRDPALVAAVVGLSDDQRRRLDEFLDPFVRVRDLLAHQRAPWVDELRGQVLAGQETALRRRRETTRQTVAELGYASQQLGSALVTGLERFDLGTALGFARTLHDGLSAGHKLKGPMGIKTKLLKEVEPFHDAVRVEGLPVDTLAQSALVLHRIEIERRLAAVEEEWGAAVERWRPHAARTARLEDDLSVLDQLAELGTHHSALVRSVSASPELARFDWLDVSATDGLREVLAADAAVRATGPLRQAHEGRVGALRRWADGQRHAPSTVADAADALAALDSDAYRLALGRIADIRDANSLALALREARAVVESRHPALAARIASTADDQSWETWLPEIGRAWAWSRWNVRLAKLTDPDAERAARQFLAEADDEVRITLRRLAEARAWEFCLARITAHQSRALNAYQLNVRKIGKGTGKYAERYRAQARENLREAQSAVPAWIMPLHQVVATVPMDRPELFDVVIVDEASQSGLEAVLLSHLAERMVVVGDDKQVSPANVGLDQEQVFSLQQRGLGALPRTLHSVINPTTSLFDFASALAAGRGRLMLKEHFRCMPEIIDFSNRLCYGGDLQPMRQYGTERLDPLVSRYVGGVIEGPKQGFVNRAEAEAVVDAVVACCADPQYEGLTLGVITMLGGGQTELIEDMLAERLSVAVRRERRLRVGTAEAFQGDERHVVFMSLVVSRTSADSDDPRRIGSFSREHDQQRLNVAASRAQNQVQVFSSIHPGDLGETDLRRGYLEYLARPGSDRDAYVAGDVSPDLRREPFDSLFEQRVYLALRERGYRVRPQYPAGRYRIDLVVEGGTRRLAIECDGDAYHGEDNAESDAGRQRDLERVGWRFVRIRGSRFYRDPEEALGPLWRELGRLGIEPVGSGTAAVGR